MGPTAVEAAEGQSDDWPALIWVEMGEMECYVAVAERAHGKRWQRGGQRGVAAAIAARRGWRASRGADSRRAWLAQRASAD